MIIKGLGREWLWDETDDQNIGVRGVIFHLAPTVRQVVTQFVPTNRRRTCIQAGGNFGVYPWLLANVFKTVYTCEPDPVLFPLLQANLAGTPNIRALPYGLGRHGALASMVTANPKNRGCQWTKPDKTGDVTIVNIDGLELTDVDFIQLDIEGSEMEALLGAVETITRDRPVIQLEHKNLGDRFGHAKEDTVDWLLTNHDYRVAWRPHRDIVLVPK